MDRVGHPHTLVTDKRKHFNIDLGRQQLEQHQNQKMIRKAKNEKGQESRKSHIDQKLQKQHQAETIE